jgi:HEAT repeat protein
VLARDPDPSVVALLHDRLGHPHPRVRLHAHRLLRSCETREAYLEATLRLLADPIDDVRRSAIRTVGHARFAPAVPALVALLTDKSAPVRRAAAEALVYLGEPSRGALRRALAGARPDRRDVYAQVLERLGTDDA